MRSEWEGRKKKQRFFLGSVRRKKEKAVIEMECEIGRRPKLLDSCFCFNRVKPEYVCKLR